MALTVKQMRDLLNELDESMDDYPLILSSDAEGNKYSPVSSVEADMIYVADSTYSGDVYDMNWTAEEAGMTEDEWEEFKANNPQALVIYPIN